MILNFLKTVDQIIADVRQHGDAHVLKLTQQFDRHPAHQFSDLELTQAELKAAFEGLNSEVREALEFAAERIREFHQAQKQEGWTYVDALGNTLGQKVTPFRSGGYLCAWGVGFISIFCIDECCTSSCGRCT